jgi:hypothetical protein
MAPITNGAAKPGAEQATTDASTDDTKNLWNRYEYARYGDNIKNELIEVRSHPPTWRARRAKVIGCALTLSRTSSLAIATLPRRTKNM